VRRRYLTISLPVSTSQTSDKNGSLSKFSIS
jgi:hypothetical protein